MAVHVESVRFGQGRHFFMGPWDLPGPRRRLLDRLGWDWVRQSALAGLREAVRECAP